MISDEPALEPISSEDIPIDGCCIKPRYLRNFAYVNIAGWMSPAGGLVGGYWPHPAGIIIGGSLSSVANAISTWLAWEKLYDNEMEKTVVKRFPKLGLKVNEISHKLTSLTDLTKICLASEKMPKLILEDLVS